MIAMAEAVLLSICDEDINIVAEYDGGLERLASFIEKNGLQNEVIYRATKYINNWLDGNMDFYWNAIEDAMVEIGGDNGFVERDDWDETV